jgi:hypothetical protein
MIRHFEGVPDTEMVPDAVIAKMVGVTFAAIDRRKRDSILLGIVEAGPISVPDFVQATLQGDREHVNSASGMHKATASEVPAGITSHITSHIRPPQHAVPHRVGMR